MRRLIIALLCLLFLSTAICIASSSESSTGALLQVRVQIGNLTFLKTLIVNNKTYILRLCNLKPGTDVQIELARYSNYGISRVAYLTPFGQERAIVVTKYQLNSVIFRVPSEALCILVELSRKPYRGWIRPIGNITLRYQVVNGNITVDESTVPYTAVISGKIAKLAYVDLCLLSLAPVHIKLYTEEYAVLIRNDTELLNGYLIYRECIRSYVFPLKLTVIGAATVQITAYYGIPVKLEERNTGQITVRLSQRLARSCANVQICNSTLCGKKVKAEIGDYLIVSVSGIAIARLKVDSAFNKTVSLALSDLVPATSIRLLDRDGYQLNESTVDVILRGPITTELRGDICIPEGTYTIIMRLYNRTYILGQEHIGANTVIQLPVKMYLVRYNEHTDVHRVVFYIKDIRLVNPHIILLPPGTTLEDVRVVLKVRGSSIETWFNVYNNTILVRSCVAAVRFNVHDFLGFPVSNAKLILLHGRHEYTCRGDSLCQIPCGDYLMRVLIGSDIIREQKVAIDPETREITITLNIFSHRSTELIAYALITAVAILVASAVRKFVRRNEEEEEVIEIQ